MDINGKDGYTCWVCGRPIPKDRAMWIRRGGRYVPIQRTDFIFGVAFTIVFHKKGSGNHEARGRKRG